MNTARIGKVSFEKSSIKKKNNLLINFFGKGFFLTLSLFAILVLLVFLLSSDLTKIKDITITPNKTPCASSGEVMNSSQILGKNFFLFDEAKTDLLITSKFKCIDSVKINKIFPNKIEINLTERKPALIFKLIKKEISMINLDLLEATPSTVESKLNFDVMESSVSSQVVTDKSGVILDNLARISTESAENLPQIYLVTEETNLKGIIPNNIASKAIEIINKLAKLSITFFSFKVEENSAYIKGSDNIIISLEKDLVRQLASLQLILQKAKMNSERMELIDLRFNKPVVVYSSKKK